MFPVSLSFVLSFKWTGVLFYDRYIFRGALSLVPLNGAAKQQWEQKQDYFLSSRRLGRYLLDQGKAK